MLQLKHIQKIYKVGDMTVDALRGVSLDFRQNEFVAILGPSGCGKTTMLNIIGGLDRYTSGDLVINEVSTKQYKDVDWDIYRNNSIGFVFQSYNLIPHQSALANVELALTLAGISKSEGRRRATEALERVGLGDQLKKRPNQMSGGQMQRVAIARALVNNPDILLADEPTGALDSETSLQIMEILKDIAKDRLVVMVTHNPEIANDYATRIIRLLDGRVIDDTNPFHVEQVQKDRPKGKKKKISMSFITALSLSMNNLLTKKARTLLTAFAGSIGIIGIALIMSLSSGMQTYIDNLEKDTLSTYPIQLESQFMDFTGMMTAMMSSNTKDGIDHDLDKVYANTIVTDMVESITTSLTTNDLARFMEYIETEGKESIESMTNSIQYRYNLDLQIYHSDTSNGVLQINPSDVYSKLGMGGGGAGAGMSGMQGYGGGGAWSELLDNRDILEAQYDVLAGGWPSAYNEFVLVVDDNNEINDISLYSLGLLDAGELDVLMENAMKGEFDPDNKPKVTSFSFDELLSLTYKLILPTDYYTISETTGLPVDMRDDEIFMKNLVDSAPELKLCGILRPTDEATAAAINSSAAYTSALTSYVIEATLQSDLAKKQIDNPAINVFTGYPFDLEDAISDLTIEDIYAYMDAIPEEQRPMLEQMTDGKTEEELFAMLAPMIEAQLAEGETETYNTVCAKLGIVEASNPSGINLYPKDFTAKEELIEFIGDYNQLQTDNGEEEATIQYTDIVGMMTSGISSIIDIVSYVLIAFVAISLIVSSIMIAIITYISVLERTKEIGILRSIGASKGDISRVFNAETIIEGLVAGIIGVGITILLNIPINMIIKALADISGIAALPVTGAIGLIILSIFLTVLAGFVPSKIAAKKDPVEALRSE